MTDLERYEIKAEAFRISTGYTAPGKDVAALAHGAPFHERAAAWDKWDADNGAIVNAMFLAFKRVMEVQS